MTTLQHFRTITSLARNEERAYDQMKQAYNRHQLDKEREADPKYRDARKKAQEALDTLNNAVDAAFPAFFPHIDPSKQFNAAMTARGRIFSAVYRTNH